MRTLQVRTSRRYLQPPKALYDIVSNYHDGLPQILPKNYFKGWDIEQGGQGAGTIVNVTMSFLGKRFPFRLAVTEPEPGKVLVETDTDTGKYTRFTFEALRNQGTILTIDSEIPIESGIVGYFKAHNVAFFAKRIYKQEMKNLTVLLNNRLEEK